MDMVQIWGLPDREFKITLSYILKTLKEKVSNMQEQMNNVRRQIDMLRKYQRELLGVKNTVTNTNSAFYKLINRLGVA